MVTRTDWHGLVKEYTCCKLSMPSDKFVAIGGLAKIIHQEHGWDYIAGLWWNTMASDLLWTPNTRHHLRNSANPLSAPSWSWASALGPVLFPKLTSDRATVQVQSVWPSSSSLVNNFGQLPTLIRLRLRCHYLLPVKLSQMELTHYVIEGPFKICGTVDPAFVHMFHVDFDFDVEQLRNSTLSLLDPQKQFYCLVLLEPSSGSRLDKLHGLFLLPTENQGEYQRVGTFKPKICKVYDILPPNDRFDEWIEAINLVGGDSVAEFADVVVRGDGLKYYFIDLVRAAYLPIMFHSCSSKKKKKNQFLERVNLALRLDGGGMYVSGSQKHENVIVRGKPETGCAG